MERNGICYLVKEIPGAHGIAEPIETEERMVYCSERSVSMNEVYQAQAVGIAPEIILRIPHAFDYGGEKLVRYMDGLYKVVRTYAGKHEYVDLTLTRMEGNAYVE